MRKSGGFTLIELVVVLVLIGLLLAFSPLALDAVVAERELEKETSRYGTTIELLSHQAMLDRTNYAIHIDTENHKWAVQVPEEVVEQGGEVGDEPFMKEEDDPWGLPYYIEKLGRRKFRICSAGPDGDEGTDDDLCYPDDDER